jgi:hypothetical protein
MRNVPMGSRPPVKFNWLQNAHEKEITITQRTNEQQVTGKIELMPPYDLACSCQAPFRVWFPFFDWRDKRGQPTER